MTGASEEYLRTSRPRLLRAARLASGSWTDGEDLLHECLVRTLGKLEALASDRDRDAYVLRSMYRLQARRSRRRWRGEIPSVIDDRANPGEDLDESLRVREALAALPPRQRMTLICRFYLDLSVDQTAHIMGCGAGTVKSQTAHSLDQLRRRLSEVPVDTE